MRIPTVVVLGATGRIGGILRRGWAQGAGQGRFDVLWQARAGAGTGPQTDPESDSETWAVFDPLKDPDALARAVKGARAILCLAGVVPGRGGDMADNAALARAAIRAGAISGAKVLLTSSAAVYGARPGVLDEATPLAPVSAYGQAKADMEARGAELAHDLGVVVCALRIGNIAGVDAILGGWKPGFSLDRFADGRTPRRSYIGAQTLTRVLGDLLMADRLPGVLNVASPGPVEMGALLDAAGLDWVPRPAPDGAIDVVALSTEALARYTSLPEISPAALVGEWRAMTGAP
jgi:nucleoside-diphosphate-sugar epimerase